MCEILTLSQLKKNLLEDANERSFSPLKFMTLINLQLFIEAQPLKIEQLDGDS